MSATIFFIALLGSAPVWLCWGLGATSGGIASAVVFSSVLGALLGNPAFTGIDVFFALASGAWCLARPRKRDEPVQSKPRSVKSDELAAHRAALRAQASIALKRNAPAPQMSPELQQRRLELAAQSKQLVAVHVKPAAPQKVEVGDIRRAAQRGWESEPSPGLVLMTQIVMLSAFAFAFWCWVFVPAPPSGDALFKLGHYAGYTWNALARLFSWQ